MEAEISTKAEGYRVNEFMNLYFYRDLLQFLLVDLKKPGQIDALILEL